MPVAVGSLMQLELSQATTDSTDLSLLWQHLLGGRLFVADTYCADGRCFAVLEPAFGRRRPRPLGVRILERVFEGESQKVLASELDLSVATVSCHSMRALRAMSQQHHVSRAPIILIMAALAARGLQLGPARFERRLDEARWVISVEVPGQSFSARLSGSEWRVARLTIQGESHAEIARARGRSLRTIANQLASVFDKLGAFGRAELRARAVREASSRQLVAA